jgi:hypothetical protein
MIKRYVLAACGIALCSPVLADDDNCAIPQATVVAIQNQLKTVVVMKNGGIFGVGGLFPTLQNFMWSAVVDRKGRLCSVIKTGDAWPGSRAIAIAKAGTANDFSNATLALSTANLYAPTQPGGSLYGLNNSNPFNPDFLAPHSGKDQFAGASSPSAGASLSIKVAKSSEVWASAATARAPIMRSLIACARRPVLTESPLV